MFSFADLTGIKPNKSSSNLGESKDIRDATRLQLNKS